MAQLEKDIQAQIVQLLEGPLIGAKVYKLGTVRKRSDYQGTMQTPGIADLEVFLPAKLHPSGRLRPLRMLKIEVKSQKGRMSPVQQVYRQYCLKSDTAHIVGGVDEVIRWLILHRYMNSDQVSAERKSVGQRRRGISLDVVRRRRAE